MGDAWPWFWAAWAALGLAVEGAAVASRHWPGTLSHQVRWIVRRHPAVRWGSLIGFLGFSAWFADHIWL